MGGAEFKVLLARAEQRIGAGDWQTAAEVLEQALALEPRDSVAQFQWARALYQLGRFSDSHAAALASEASSPRDAELLFALARHLVLFGERDAVLRCLRHPRFRSDASPEALLEACTLLSGMGENDEASKLIELVLHRKPGFAQAHYFRGNLRMFHGDTQGAEADYRSCLRRMPGFGQAYWALSGLRRATPESHCVEEIQRELARAHPQGTSQIFLNFALFNELHELQRHDEAWQALQRGCRLKREAIRYRHPETLALLRAIEASTQVDTLPVPELGAPTDAPVFIVGMHRSGTTLLEQMLAGHPQLQDGGESYAFSIELRLATDSKGVGVVDQRMLDRLGAVDFQRLGQSYLARNRWKTGAKQRFTEKLPANHQIIGLIARALPGARFLHLVRDPVETCFSNLRTLFNHAAGYSYDPIEVADYFIAYRRLMAHWHAQLPGRIMDVHFPELVAEPERVAREVLDFCALPWHAEVVGDRSRRGPVATASAAQVRGALDPRRSEAWRPYADYLEPMRARLRELSA